jgi:hypothetical protein
LPISKRLITVPQGPLVTSYINTMPTPFKDVNNGVSGLKSPRKQYTYEDLVNSWYEGGGIPGSIPENKVMRSYQSQGGATQQQPMSPLPLFQSQGMHSATLSVSFFNTDGTAKRASPNPFEDSQVNKDEKDDAVASKKSKPSIAGLSFSSLNRARSYRDVPKLDRRNLDDFIRIQHYITANIELYTLSKETVPDCLRAMEQVIQKKIGDVTTKINLIQIIAVEGEEYQLPTSCLTFNFFKKKKPAEINASTRQLLTLLSFPAKEESFINNLNTAYEETIQLVNEKKSPSSSPSSIRRK